MHLHLCFVLVNRSVCSVSTELKNLLQEIRKSNQDLQMQMQNIEETFSSRFISLERKVNVIAEDLIKKTDPIGANLPAPAEDLNELETLMRNPALVRTLK